MTPERLLELLKIERECILRNSIPFGCDRRCGECDLVQDTDELLEMYDMVTSTMEKLPMTIEIDLETYGRKI